MKEALQQLIDTIHRHRGSYAVHSGEDLLDCLWYLGENRHLLADIPDQLDPSTNEPADQSQSEKERTDSDSDRATPPENPSAPTNSQPTAEEHRSHPTYADTGAQPSLPGRKIPLPPAAALPTAEALADALQPLARRVTTASTDWDVERMVDYFADSCGMWQPFPRQQREPLYEVALVSEHSPSVRFWGPLLDELEQVLSRYAHLPVRRYRLQHTAGATRLEHHYSQTTLPLSSLAAPGRRRAILFFTDSLSSAWQQGGVATAVLGAWSRSHPVSIVTPWSAQMREGTRLGQLESGWATMWREQTAQWRTEEAGTGSQPLFFLPLSADWVEQWVKAVSGQGASPALAAPPASATDKPLWPVPDTSRTEPPSPIDTDALLHQFYKTAQPHTQQLARALAAVPLYPPVMRLVQQGMVPGSDHSALAELLLSGLVYLHQRSPDAERCLYEFRPQQSGQRSIRDQLLDSSRAHEMEQVWRLMGDHIDYLSHTLGVQRRQLEAFVADSQAKSSSDQVLIDATAQPFAQIRGRVLLRLEAVERGKSLIKSTSTKVESTAPREGPRVYLSYLRHDVPSIGTQVARSLRLHFGNENLFYDTFERIGASSFHDKYPTMLDKSDLVLLLCNGNAKRKFQLTRFELRLVAKYSNQIIGLTVGNIEIPSDLEQISFYRLSHEPSQQELLRLAEYLETIYISDSSKQLQAVNTLGMEFVPVPGLPGIEFSRWQTRVQDYAVYASEAKGVDMSWRNYEYKGEKQDLDHPVINVSWKDAVKFCQWLSKREGVEYRLPSDHEWSEAVGIGAEEDPSTSPRVKDGQVPGYPWGKKWPPRVGLGNYAGEETKKFYFNEISGYEDEYPFTAPVGSFDLEHHGIKDLSGNVWEWCQDWYDEETKESRVLRGGSWVNGNERHLLSSFRSNGTPSFRDINMGFRCVRVVG